MKTSIVAVFLAVVISFSAQAAEPTANDTARFLAGMEPAADSPLTPLTKEAAWQQYSKSLNSAFSTFQSKQFPRIREWSNTNLPNPQQTLFYMFSGPDFIYANAFFPNATTYILSALEPVGQIPDMTKMPRGSMSRALSDIQISLRSILSYSFFITKQMKTDLRTSRVEGTLPILYVFLARSGMTLKTAELIHLDEAGAVQMGDGRNARTGSRGVKIVFTDAQSKERTLYYFSTNLANGNFNTSGFEKFLEKFGTGDAFIKSASYLPHSGNFGQVRKFLIDHANTIVQDDSGVPVAYFDDKVWKTRVFGRYLYPLGIFPGTHQKKLQDLYARTNPPPIDFGLGYRWRPRESNLILATKAH